MGDLVEELYRSHNIRTLVLTSQPHYGGDAEPAPSRESTTWGEIIRVAPLRGISRHSFLGRVLGFLWLTFQFFLKTIKIGKTPCMIVSGNPPTLPLVALWLNRCRGERYHVLVDDIYPEAAVAVGKISDEGPVATVWHAFNRLLYAGSRGVITLGEKMRSCIVGQHANLNIDVVPYWAPPPISPKTKAESEFARNEGLMDTFVVLYSGNHGRLHNLEALIEAATELQDEPFTFVFVGSGAKKATIEKMTEDRDLKNVRFYPYQPLEKVADVLASADASAVCLARGNEGLALPSKLWGILASARPVLAFAEDDSEISRVVAEGSCGVSISHESGSACATSALRDWQLNQDKRKQMGESGRRYQQRYHSVQSSAVLYAEIIRKTKSAN